MADLQVTCINKQPRNDTHSGIKRLAGVNPADSTGWQGSRQNVIDDINNKLHTFFTLVRGKRANVGVNGTAPNQWVQTYADKQWDNNLLSLPEC